MEPMKPVLSGNHSGLDLHKIKASYEKNLHSVLQEQGGYLELESYSYFVYIIRLVVVYTLPYLINISGTVMEYHRRNLRE